MFLFPLLGVLGILESLNTREISFNLSPILSPGDDIRSDFQLSQTNNRPETRFHRGSTKN